MSKGAIVGAEELGEDSVSFTDAGDDVSVNTDVSMVEVEKPLALLGTGDVLI